MDTNNDTKKQKKDDKLNGVQVIDYPNRTLPKLIEELLDKEIPIRLSKNGYYIAGFYGLNTDTENAGFAFAKDTSEAGTLVLFDSKMNKHLVRDFSDVVKFHNLVWGHFYKLSESYKKPDDLWFKYMLEYGVLTITPGNIR